MLKKACAAAAAAAGLMMFGATGMASASPADGFEQVNGPLLSAVNANNVNTVIGVCGNNVGVLGAAVPVNSPIITETCAAGGIDDGDDVNFEG